MVTLIHPKRALSTMPLKSSAPLGAGSGFRAGPSLVKAARRRAFADGCLFARGGVAPWRALAGEDFWLSPSFS